MNKNLKLENLSSSYLSDISDPSQKNSEKKNYYLYKIGGKLVLKKKKLKESSTKKIIPKNKSSLKNIVSHIHSLFNYKYTKMIQYDTTIINRLIFNINSKVVTTFKENLILSDLNEFLYHFYERKKSEQILKKLLNYYEVNNIIYPNYIALYEGNYIFNNIEQKQKIIDRQEKMIKNGEKNEIENDKEENILNSKVVESILNQTNTSETKRFFGLKDDNNLIEEDDFEQINDLIKNIDTIEKKGNNKIFKKKNFIRIINPNNNNIDNKPEKNNKKSYIKELLSTISYFEKLDDKSKFKLQNHKENNKNNNTHFFSKTNYNNLVIKKNIKLNSSKIHKRINTLDTEKMRPKYKILSFNNHNLNESNNSFKNPYVIKRPINIDNITYSKKKISQNISRAKNIYIHKTSRSISSLNNSNLHLETDYFYLDNNSNLNGIKIYKKKLQKIYTEQNVENKKINCDSNSVNKIHENNIRNFKKINKKQISIPIHTYMSSNRNAKRNLYDSKYKYNRVSPSPNFKLISKMIKTKYLIDDKINRNLNSVSLTARNTVNNINFKDIKNKFHGKDNNNFTTKNIYISNNITNNNFYTINNGPKKNMKLLIYRSNKHKNNTELNRIKANKINIKEYKLDKNGNIYINTERNQKIRQSQLSNNIKTKDINFTRRINKTNSINQYKNGLINSTILKSLDKNSLNSLLNKFRIENSNYERTISLPNNNIRYTTINEMKHKYNKSYQKKF